jgi:hypothetical protein
MCGIEFKGRENGPDRFRPSSTDLKMSGAYLHSPSMPSFCDVYLPTYSVITLCNKLSVFKIIAHVRIFTLCPRRKLCLLADNLKKNLSTIIEYYHVKFHCFLRCGLLS